MSEVRAPSAQVMKLLAAAIEICGSQMSPAAVRVMGDKLAAYPEEAVLKALDRCMSEVTGRLSLAAIIQRIDDGRPSADEAWAQVGTNDENVTLVTTDEAMLACGEVRLLMEEGDMVAARMAFKSAYERIVTANRANGVKVKWRASLGFDKPGQVRALTAGVQAGKLDAEWAARLLGTVTAAELLGQAPAPLALPGETRQAAEERKAREAQRRLSDGGDSAPQSFGSALMATLASKGPPKCGDPECNGFSHNGKPCPQWGIKDDGEGR